MIKEIGDIYEVLDTLMQEFEILKEDVIALQKERREKRGGFQKRIFLEYTEK